MKKESVEYVEAMEVLDEINKNLGFSSMKLMTLWVLLLICTSAHRSSGTIERIGVESYSTLEEFVEDFELTEKLNSSMPDFVAEYYRVLKENNIIWVRF